MGANTMVAVKPAYTIVDLDIKDPAAFEEYRNGHLPTIEKYGGKLLVRGGQFEVMEGDWNPRRIVIHQWPSLEAFHRWYNSEEYKHWKELRQRAAVARVVVVEGL